MISPRQTNLWVIDTSIGDGELRSRAGCWPNLTLARFPAKWLADGFATKRHCSENRVLGLVGAPRLCQHRPMRDPKTTPHPGDRFRCKNGTELEATGAVFSVTKAGRQTPCLYVDRIVKGHVVSRGVSTVGVFKSSVRTAALVARGSDEDPWVDAKRRPHSEF